MKNLQIANGDFFSTYGGGQVYVKNLVDEMIRQGLEVAVFSFVNRKSDLPYEKKDYKGIDLYVFYTKDVEVIRSVMTQVKPNIVHAHAEKKLFASLKNDSFRLLITAHHGGITCPAGTLMNTRDEICRIPVSHRDCLPCVLRNVRGGLKVYPLIKNIPLKSRLSIGRRLDKLPFIYFVTPYGKASCQIEGKIQDWKSIVEKVDRVIAPSQAIAENMQLNGLPERKIQVISHGIKADRRQVEIGNERLRFFYLGRIEYIKGIHLLLKAFVGLDSDRCELHLVGDTSGKYEQALMKQYKGRPNIIFHGKIVPDQVLETVRQFDILVHPAIYLEVFGLNIAEALSQGKPVIATRCGGAEMQVRDRKNGLLIEPNDVNALREAMQWMLDHPGERQRMSQEAPAEVISLEEHVQVLTEFYKSLLF